MSATKVVPPPQATSACTDRPITEAQLVRGLVFGLPISALLWFLLAALALAMF